MSGIIMSNPVLVFADSSKGDIANKLECAKEQAKNDFGYILKGGTAGTIAGLATAEALKPGLVKSIGKDIFTKTASVAGKVASKTPEGVKTFAKTVGNVGEKVAQQAPSGVKSFVKNVGTTISSGFSKIAGFVKAKMPKLFYKGSAVVENLAAAKAKIMGSIKNIKVPTTAKNVFSKIGASVKNAGAKVLNAVKNIKAPGKQKVLLTLAGLAAATFVALTAKWMHKKGQIDQKYTDMASIKKHVTDIYRPVLKNVV